MSHDSITTRKALRNILRAALTPGAERSSSVSSCGNDMFCNHSFEDNGQVEMVVTRQLVT